MHVKDISVVCSIDVASCVGDFVCLLVLDSGGGCGGSGCGGGGGGGGGWDHVLVMLDAFMVP